MVIKKVVTWFETQNQKAKLEKERKEIIKGISSEAILCHLLIDSDDLGFMRSLKVVLEDWSDEIHKVKEEIQKLYLLSEEDTRTFFFDNIETLKVIDKLISLKKTKLIDMKISYMIQTLVELAEMQLKGRIERDNLLKEIDNQLSSSIMADEEIVIEGLQKLFKERSEY